MVVALAAWIFVLYSQQHPRAAAVLLGITILMRPDAVLIGAVLAGHSLLVRRRWPWQELLITSGILLPAVALAWVYYGSPLPGTLAAKIAQRDMFPRFVTGAFNWISGFTIQGSSHLYKMQAAPSMIRYIWFAALGVPALYVQRRWLLPLAWVGLYIGVYHLLRVPYYQWYGVPIIFGMMVLAGIGAGGVVEIVTYLTRQFVFKRVQLAIHSRIFTAALVLAAVAMLLPGLYRQFIYDQNLAVSQGLTEQVYEKVGRWLAATLPVNASIGYYEIGRIGFYSQRSVIDALGLVNPGVAPAIEQRNFTWAYQHFQPTYIMDSRDLFGPHQMLEQEWFKQQYRFVTDIPTKAPMLPFGLYERVK